MAIQTNRGIDSWHRGGFEEGLVREVRGLLDNQRREYRQDMESVVGQMNREMAELHRKINAVNGFYTWLLEVYPETVAQYKALMDLQKLGEKDE